jgi:hypothetical protein
MTMTSHTRMLAGLALTAATVVTLSSDALARGGSGFGGMRSFSVARTPTVVNRVSTSASAVRRTSATSHTTSSGTKTSSSGTKASQTKMHSCKKDCSDHHHKPPFNWMPPIPASPSQASGSPVSSDPANQGAATPVASVGDVSDNRSAGVRHHRKAEVRDHRKDEDQDDRKDEDRDDRDGSGDSESNGPQDTGGKGGGGQGGSGQEVVVNDRGGTRAAVYPVATLPSGSTGISGTQGSGGTISKERPNPLPPTSAGTGAAAASTPADAPNCVYERTVQRLPDGRLQRVVLKVCPDA